MTVDPSMRADPTQGSPASPQQETSTAAAMASAVAPLFRFLTSPESSQSFHGGQLLRATEHHVHTRMTGSHGALVRSPQTVVAYGADHFVFGRVRSGVLLVTGDGDPSPARSGDVVVLDLAQPSRLDFAGDDVPTEWTALWLPRQRLRAVVASEFALHGLAIGADTPGGNVMGAALAALGEVAAAADAELFD